MLGEELQLPRIEPRGQENITEEKAKYNSIRRTGPESLRHFNVLAGAGRPMTIHPLVIATQRVYLEGGSITIESAPGRGTTLRVEIPLGERAVESVE